MSDSSGNTSTVVGSAKRPGGSGVLVTGGAGAALPFLTYLGLLGLDGVDGLVGLDGLALGVDEGAMVSCLGCLGGEGQTR